MKNRNFHGIAFFGISLALLPPVPAQTHADIAVPDARGAAATTGAATDATAAATTSPNLSPPPSAALPDTSQIYTQEQLQQALDEKKYDLLLGQIGKIRQSKKTSDNYDTYELNWLMGEAFLGLHRNSAAAEAFSSAAKVGDDPQKVADANATAMLARNATGPVYKPRHLPAGQFDDPTVDAPSLPPGLTPHPKPAAPIELTDRIHRGEALSALFADQVSQNSKVLRDAMNATSLNAIAAAAQELDDLRVLDVAANQSDANIQKMATRLADHANKQIASTLMDVAQTVAQISNNANQTVAVQVPVSQVPGQVNFTNLYRRRGLTASDTNTLKDTMDTMEKIAPAGDALAKKLRTDPKAFDKVKAQAATIEKKAEEILNTDYSLQVPPPVNLPRH